MQKTLYIPIDTSIKNTVECTKLVKRGDTLLLIIKVFENAALTNLTGQSVDVILKKSDGTLIEKTVDVADISNGTISVRPGQQSSLVEGIVSGEVQIYTDSTLSSTNTFTYKVDASLADDVLEISQNDIQVLSDLRNLINTGEVTIAKYKDNILAIANSIEAIEALVNIKSYIDTNLVDLENANALAVVNIANENIQNDEATQNIIDLTAINNTANTLNGELESNILSGNTLNTDLESNILSGGVLNDDLEANILTSQNKINSLDTENINATNKISELETATTNAENKKQEVITECGVADDKIAAMQAFGDVTQVSQDITDIKNEINNARGTEANLDTRLDKFDTSLSESAQQLRDIAIYNATCAYASNVFTLTLDSAPTLLPNFFTVRVKMSNEWVDGSTILIGTKTYNVINAAFMLDEVVTINLDEVAAKCFFKSGGGGSGELTETLPQQVDTFTATSGNAQITFNWTLKDSVALSGFYLTYKIGTNAPANINDGIKIEITDITKTSKVVSGLTNGSTYSASIYPYNSKKQAQTIGTIASATPLESIPIKDLPIGSKIKGINPSNGNPIYFILLDKNHSGYPINSITLLCEDANLHLGAYNAYAYAYTDIDNWLCDSLNGFIKALPSWLSTALLTDIQAQNQSAVFTISRKFFLLSYYELFGTELGTYVDPGSNGGLTIYGSPFSYFKNASYRTNKQNNAYFTRSQYSMDGYYASVTSSGTYGVIFYQTNGWCRPAFNIDINSNLYFNPSPNAQGYYELIT